MKNTTARYFAIASVVAVLGAGFVAGQPAFASATVTAQPALP